MSKRGEVRDEFLKILLEEFGGEVFDPGGGVIRKIYDRMATSTSYVAVSGMISTLDRQGLVIRDMPSMKRTTRIALPEYSSHPPRKALSVVLQETSQTMVSSIEDQVSALIDAEAQRLASEVADDRLQAELGLREEEIDRLNADLAAARSEIASLRRDSGNAALQAQIDQLKQELAEEREQRRIAENNAEVWRRNAMGKPKVKEMMAAIKDRLDPAQRKQLESLMTEVPASR